ncbi:MAG: hypothetical protein ACXWLB_21650 [Reyranella sp.]
MRRRSLLVGGVAATLAAPNPVAAQGTDWPKSPIKFVVPFPPGGSTDPVARLIQARLLEMPASFATFQKVEQERWTRLIKENRIKAD